jgi:hypothetical protein
MAAISFLATPDGPSADLVREAALANIVGT